MSSFEKRPGVGVHDQGLTRRDLGQPTLPVSKETENRIPTQVGWVGLINSLADVGEFVVRNLGEEEFNLALDKGYRTIATHDIKQFRGLSTVPETVVIGIPTEHLPQEPNQQGQSDLFLGDLCTQVATHLDTWLEHNQEQITPTYMGLTLQVARSLSALALVTGDIPVTMDVKKTAQEAIAVKKMSVPGHTSYEVIE